MKLVHRRQFARVLAVFSNKLWAFDRDLRPVSSWLDATPWGVLQMKSRLGRTARLAPFIVRAIQYGDELTPKNIVIAFVFFLELAAFLRQYCSFSDFNPKKLAYPLDTHTRQI
jgi:hypothetical protein